MPPKNETFTRPDGISASTTNVSGELPREQIRTRRVPDPCRAVHIGKSRNRAILDVRDGARRLSPRRGQNSIEGRVLGWSRFDVAPLAGWRVSVQGVAA